VQVWFRNSDHRFPFFWEAADQPPARWHGTAEGPVQYLADTPDGAWAEFLRHEEITDPADLEGVARNLWAIEVADEPAQRPTLPMRTLVGGTASYSLCQQEARRLRGLGTRALTAPSAALLPGGARGQVVRGGLADAAARAGKVLVLFGPRFRGRGWVCVDRGRPEARLLRFIRPLDRR
jgi:hypothetical protein